MDLVDILAGLGPDNLAEKRKALMQWRINSAMGMLAPTTGTGVEAATRMLPMTGEAWTANDAGNAIQEGQYGKAAMMGLLGLLPLGGMMSAGLRAGATVPKRMGQSGAIAWHGSPHKFDKFSLDKIGTGEGAQAYGHGAYLAEAKDVGKEYQLALGNKPSAVDDFAGFEAQAAFAKHGGNTKKAIAWLEDRKKLTDDAKQFLMPGAYEKQIGDYNEAIRRIQSGEVSKEAGYLYKTDIPDEAVARFLDWDKPLSQQAPEVQKAIKSSPIGTRPDIDALSGNSLHDLLMFDAQDKVAAITGKARNGSQQDAVSSYLASQGIPGIRYLDGGSRSNGAGTSNFVAFDPELIRILERNGIPTGNQPWKPGEWQGMLSGTK